MFFLFNFKGHLRVRWLNMEFMLITHFLLSAEAEQRFEGLGDIGI